MSKRLPNLAPPFAETRNKLAEFFSRPFRKMTLQQKFWLGLTLLVFITSILIHNPFWHVSGENFQEGEILRQSIIAPADITVVNSEETEALKQAARSSISPIFTFESNSADLAVQRFRSAWEAIQKDFSANANTNSNTRNLSSGNVNSVEAKPGIPVKSASKKSALEVVFELRRFSNNEIDSIIRALRESSEGSIYNDSDQQYFQSQINLVDRQRPNQQSVVSLPESSMMPLSRARQKLKDRLFQIRSLNQREVEAFYTALEPYVQANVVFDSAATSSAKENAAQSIQPVSISLKRGQTIAREGDTITPNVLAQINAVKSYTESTRQSNRFLGIIFLVAALYWIAWKFIEHRGTVARLSMSPMRTFALFGFVVVIQTLIVSICFRLADFTAAQNIRAPFNDPTLWSFAIPFAFTSLLITLLADRRIALFAGLFASLIGGMIAPKGLEFVLYGMISSAVAVYGIGQYRNRQSVTTAGALVGVMNALVAIALVGYLQQPFILNTILLSIGCGLLGGLITAAVTAVFLPICESIFGILTDVKLLELSNADLPVLGQLALRAPGTNQHSHAVGQLAEDACRAVGANNLLARIGALYHDIGKLAAPEHFVENQMGRNPHDKLKPVQSAKIIITHVTYGVKLAKEMGLPPRIIDFISQHHGTRTLHYFLKKAQAEAGDTQEIEESDFRYPGPKPQFKEAAIMMIADSCEAGARSLAQPTPENIRFIVTKIIDAIVADDQLDECDLTLRELTLIRETMIKSLISIYHSRIDYPGYTPPNSLQNIIIPKESLTNDERGMKFENPADIPVGIGGEVEDEAVDLSHAPNDKISVKKTEKVG